MGRYNVHPAQGRGHYHDVKNYKERGESVEQLKEQKRLKKLRKKRRAVRTFLIWFPQITGLP